MSKTKIPASSAANPPAAVPEPPKPAPPHVPYDDDPLPRRTPKWLRFTLMIVLPVIAAIVGIEWYFHDRFKSEPVPSPTAEMMVSLHTDGQKKRLDEIYQPLKSGDSLTFDVKTVGYPALLTMNGGGKVRINTIQDFDKKNATASQHDAGHEHVRSWSFAVGPEDLPPCMTFLALSTGKPLNDDLRYAIEGRLNDLDLLPDVLPESALRWSDGRWETFKPPPVSGGKQPSGRPPDWPDRILRVLHNKELEEKVGKISFAGLTVPVTKTAAAENP